MSKTLWISLIALVLIFAVAFGGYHFWKGDSPKECLPRPRVLTPPTPQDPNVMPGGRAEDIHLAKTNPDEYAWRLFLAINRQALAGKRGLPDPNRPTIRQYEDDKPVIWETWALASGGRNGKRRLPARNTSEVFRDNGQRPFPWDQLSTDQKSFELYPSKQLKGVDDFEDAQIKADLNNKGISVRSLEEALDRNLVERLIIEPSAQEERQGIGDEVRMNRPLFEHIVANNLYNIEGLEEAFRRYRDNPDPNKPDEIDVPAASQEIKAKWVRIREEDKPRYHWRLIQKNGETQIWGLTALHIMTKDLQDWFWTDFEHIDYLDLPVQAVDADFGSDIVDRAEVESRDNTTRDDAPQGALDCEGNFIQGLRGETIGTKWANYRLRGTQTTFTCGDAESCEQIPTILANTQLERGFQQTSSCITCHARASIGERAAPEKEYFPERMDVFLSIRFLRPAGFLLEGAIGEKKDEWFIDSTTKKLKYIQTDYMWSLSERAQSTNNSQWYRIKRPRCDQPCPQPSPSKPSP